MRTYPLQSALQGLPVERPDEARLALRRAVQATLEEFAEMDRLLDRAERLISHQRSDHAPQQHAERPYLTHLAEAHRTRPLH